MNNKMSLKNDINKYVGITQASFCAPGHKESNDFLYLEGSQSLDIKNINAKPYEKRSAEFFNVKSIRYLTNGVRSGIFASIRCLVKNGETILVARNANKSVFDALSIFDINVEYVMPPYLEDLNCFGSIYPYDVEKILNNNKNIKAFVLTSPTYEGIVSDIYSIARICEEHNVRLIVDESYGSHLGLFNVFGESAKSLGADIVINDFGYNMATLVQGAVISVCSDKINIKELDSNISLFEAEKKSSLIMSSIDELINLLINSGEEYLKYWLKCIRDFKYEMKINNSFEIFSPIRNANIFNYDESKIIIKCNGRILKEALIGNGIDVENSSVNYVVLNTGMGNKKEHYLLLEKFLLSLNKDMFSIDYYDEFDVLHSIAIMPQKALNPYETALKTCEYVNISEMEGKISAENIFVNPPGINLINKGEIVDNNVLETLAKLVHLGAEIKTSNNSFPKILIAK